MWGVESAKVIEGCVEEMVGGGLEERARRCIVVRRVVDFDEWSCERIGVVVDLEVVDDRVGSRVRGGGCDGWYWLVGG